MIWIIILASYWLMGVWVTDILFRHEDSEAQEFREQWKEMGFFVKVVFYLFQITINPIVFLYVNILP
jgi:hypothetical protein